VKRRTPFLLAALTASLRLLAAEPAAPPVMFAEPLSQRNASYAIAVELDPKAHTLKATERIRWRNLTEDTVSDAAFHLYLNAFANSESVFMKESGGSHRGFEFDRGSWGYCRVLSMAQLAATGAQPLTLTYPGPDRTVARVTLAAPVPPGGETEFAVIFEDQLPRVFARAGFAGEFNIAGQWFPKLGVYQAGKGWNCHPYHLNSEFFSDFGVYDVEVTLPEHFILGSTGVPWKETHAAGKKTVSIHAEDVHDFAFCASPDFLVHEETWEGVKIRILAQPGNRESIPRYAEAVRKSLEYYAAWIYKYPYPQITLVDPPQGGEGAGGMEYPMFFTGMTSPFIPKSMLMAEMVAVHEFGHEYWYGMSANNEFEEAWLDEGINSYYETRVLDAWKGPDRSMMDGLLGFHMGDVAQQRIQYLSVPDLDPIVQPSWEYRRFGTYAAMSYSKPAVALKTLEGILGTQKMDAVMRAFFNEVKFRHPTTEDFLRITSEAAGRDLRGLLVPMLFGTDTVDFKVAEVRSIRREKPEGYDLTKNPPALFEAPRGTKAGASDKGEKAVYDSRVTLHRKGGLVIPVEVRITFSDKSVKKETWDGAGRQRTFTFEGPKVTRVEVDPEGKIPLDLQRLNNSWLSKGDGAPAASLGARFQIGFQLLFAALGELL